LKNIFQQAAVEFHIAMSAHCLRFNLVPKPQGLPNMLAAAELHAIARQIKTAQDQGLPLTQITSQHTGFDALAAYAVADLIHAMRLADGARVVGRKIGFTNPAMWPQYGVSDPVWAYVYDTTVTYLVDNLAERSDPQTCSLHGFVQPKIEPEIIFHFHSVPPPDGDTTAVLACIDWVAHGFEMVQSHYPGWKFKAPDAIADWGMHGRLLVGKPQAVDTLGAGLQESLAAFTLALSCDGKLQETGKGANVLGNPLAAVVHLMQVLASQSPHQRLLAGEIVTTGTVTSAYSVQVGQTWQTAIEGIALPGLSVAFTG
jgi:2-keto-4-pentenoate hydratase